MKTYFTADGSTDAYSLLEGLTEKRSEEERRREAVEALRTTREKLSTPDNSILWEAFRAVYLELRLSGFSPVRSGSAAAQLVYEVVQEFKEKKLADDLEREMLQ